MPLTPYVARHILSVKKEDAMGTKFSDYIEESKASATPEQRELDVAFAAHFEAVHLEHFGLGEQLSRARQESHVTQAKLAELSGVPQPEISRIENGQGNPTKETLTRVGEPLGLILTYAVPRIGSAATS
jgi:DNA-binding XRE family transcriptional regulator